MPEEFVLAAGQPEDDDDMKTACRVMLLAMAVILGLPALLAQKERPGQAPQTPSDQTYHSWLRADVIYIITDEEKAAWKRLQTDAERESFIEQFWLRRDPTPDTIENEFKDEHYRRIAYANQHFSSSISGWKTDRGRIYIMFGPPDEIDAHPNGESYERPAEQGGGRTTTFPFENWRYRYIEGVGKDVALDFVDTTLSGEYRLTMDPSESDGPVYAPQEALPAVAIDGGRRIRVKFKELEAIVESKITYHQLPFQTHTDFVKLIGNTVLAVVTVQLPHKEGAEHAAVNVFGRVSSAHRVEQTFEHLMPAQDTYAQNLYLRPGQYRLNLVLKDPQSGNIGTIEKTIVVPAFDDTTLSSSSLILKDKAGQRQPDLYLQIYNLGVDQTTGKPSASIEYALLKDGKVLHLTRDKSEDISGANPRQITVEKALPLAASAPGRYVLRAKITDNVAKKSITPSASFTVPEP